MVSFDKIKVGDVLYDVHRTTMGNTKMSRLGWWEVRVFSIDAKNRTAVVSWNGNPQRMYNERSIKRLRRSKPKEKSNA